MAVGAMVSFIAAALAILSLGRPWQGWHPSTVLAGVVAVVGGLGVLGYLYGAEQFTRTGSMTQIAFPAALALLVLSVGLVAARSDQDVMRVLTDRELSGQLTRRFLPTALLVVPFSVWLMLQLEQVGVLDERDGAAVVVTFEILLLGVIGVWMAGRTLRLEDSRTEARRERDGLFDTSDDLICAMDTEGLLILVSPSWTRLMGYEPGDLLGRPLSEFVHPDELGPTMEEPFRRAEFSQRVSGDVNRCRAHDGTYRWFEWNGNRDPETGRIFAAGRDVSDRKQAEFELLNLNAKLEERAMRDPLTGLANRRLLDELLAASLSRVERLGQPLQVIYVDLDEFKAVNDMHGHAAGDAFLQETSRRLTATVRTGDIVARVGGDEFVIVLQPAVDAFESFRARVERALAEPTDVGGGVKVSCTASIGLADSRTMGTEAARLLSAADADMYARKSVVPER
jgi:diguanylate cyclase (GGDEF)-like protein/PAS domain S-box-containing protein